MGGVRRGRDRAGDRESGRGEGGRDRAGDRESGRGEGGEGQGWG